MAYEVNLETITLEAGADLSAKQYFFVTQDATDKQVDPTGAGALAMGVLQNNPSAAGKAATIAICGVTKLSAGAAITRGALLAADTNGQAVAATTGNYILAQAIDAATAKDQIITAKLIIGGAKA